MAMERIKRTTRRPGVRVQVTTRDERLLRALGRFQMARTSDLIRLCFPGVRRDTVNARLRRLYDASLLEVRMTDRAEDNVYSHGPEGRRLLHVTGRVPHVGAHHLAIVRFWTELAVAAHEQRLQLRSFVPDWELRRTASGVVPDAIVELGVEQFALEVDRGTESLATLANKIRAYRDNLLTLPDGIGLVVVHEGRAAALHELLRREWNSWWRLLPVEAPLPTPLALRGFGAAEVVGVVAPGSLGDAGLRNEDSYERGEHPSAV
jgi:hypothetical protein